MIRTGLCVGSADLIGMLAPQGRFLALEVKRPGEKPTREQELFLELVRKSGGVAAVVHSVEEALAVVGPGAGDRRCGECDGSGAIEDDRGCYVRQCSDCDGKGTVRVGGETCGEKATVTKRCLLAKGHSGAHDEDP